MCHPKTLSYNEECILRKGPVPCRRQAKSKIRAELLAM